MAKKQQPYDSIIDALLDDREPDWKELGLTEAHASGEEVADRTHQYVDTDFEDEIAESASRHTPIPNAKSGAHTYEQRIADKEKATPRLGVVQADWHTAAMPHADDYNTRMGDNDELMNEVTMDLSKADPKFGENNVKQKEWTDGQIQNYVRQLLNQGVAPSKVAAKLEKLAEIELFNRQSATDYLQRNAGLMGLAYLEPNTYMQKNSPTYERTAGEKADLGGAACVAQKKAWDAAGIKPQAHSVKQVKACEGCTYFNKDARGKACNLYHLPVVASTNDLNQIVNHLTPGVPEKRKHAALVQIANGEGKRVQPTAAAGNTNVVKTADAKVKNQQNRTAGLFSDAREEKTFFSNEHIGKMHEKGASLEQIYKWASEKFGDVDTSMAFRAFVQSFKKDQKGSIVIASADRKFLSSIGIRNESYKDGAKCASCPAHFGRQEREVEEDRGAQRVEGKFSQRTASAIAGSQPETKEIVVTAAKVRTLHQAGHSVQKIYNGAASKVGSVQAKKAVAAFVEDMKKRPGKIAVSEQDRAFLIGKLGFKPEAIRMLDPLRRPVTQVTAAIPDDAHVLSYPGAHKQAAEKKATDGMSILNEYDLVGHRDMQDIDTNGPKREDIEMNDTFKVDF